MKRAEWIDFVSTFFNLEAKSNEVFGQIEQEYACHADNGELYVHASTLTLHRNAMPTSVANLLFSLASFISSALALANSLTGPLSHGPPTSSLGGTTIANIGKCRRPHTSWSLWTMQVRLHERSKMRFLCNANMPFD